MAEFQLAIAETAGADLGQGTNVPTSATWLASFDHAALVAAGRSRADGLDLWMYHATAGAVQLVTVLDPNTTSCKLSFNLATGIAGFGTDNGYRVVFGNLSRGVSPTFSAGSPAGVFNVSVASPPALALPVPAFPLIRTRLADTRGVDWPDFAVMRHAALNENAREVVAAEWRDVSGEDFYEIRNVVRAWSPTTPSWWTGSYGLRPLPESMTVEQYTATGFRVSCEFVEDVVT